MTGLRLSRQTWMLAFFTVLHLLVLFRLLGVIQSGRIVVPLTIATAIPITLTIGYLVSTRATPERSLSGLDGAVLVYAVYSLASVVAYFQPGAPSDIRAYVYGVYYFVFPLACFFGAKAIAPSRQMDLVRWIAYLNVLALGYALYLHWARPVYYKEFVINEMLSEKGYTTEAQFFLRLQSYFGSATVGVIGPATIVLLALSERTRRLRPAFMIVVLTAATAFSMQRAGIIAGVLALGYVLLLARWPARTRVWMFLLVVISLVFGVGRFKDAFGPFGGRLQERVTSGLVEGLSRLSSDRGYDPGWRYLAAFPLGVGLGATSSAADSVGLASWGQVVDANFMRIAADLGAPGFMVFLCVMIMSVRAAWRSQHPFGWLCFLAIFYGIMLVTNILDSYYVSQFFWFCLGVMDCSSKPKTFTAAPAAVKPDARSPSARSSAPLSSQRLQYSTSCTL